MKKAFTFLFTVITSMSIYAQSFEGKILYANAYKSKNPKMTDQQWTSMMGSTQEYLIEDGDYKSISNGTRFCWVQCLQETQTQDWCQKAGADQVVLLLWRQC